MASESKNLSKFEFEVPSAEGLSFGIVAASWNSKVTDALLEGAIKTLLEAGAEEKDILVKRVPGAYELTYGAKLMCEYTDVDAIIVLGAIIKGGTPHFDFIAQGVTQGINLVTMQNVTPIAFGVLTTNNMEEALDRAGGKFGNKGEEAAATAIAMARLDEEMFHYELENREPYYYEEDTTSLADLFASAGCTDDFDMVMTKPKEVNTKAKSTKTQTTKATTTKTKATKSNSSNIKSLKTKKTE